MPQLDFRRKHRALALARLAEQLIPPGTHRLDRDACILKRRSRTLGDPWNGIEVWRHGACQLDVTWEDAVWVYVPGPWEATLEQWGAALPTPQHP